MLHRICFPGVDSRRATRIALMESPPLLLDLLLRQTAPDIKNLLLRHTLETSVPRKKKAELAQMLLNYVLEEPETRYRKVLADFSKKALHSILPVRAAKKADAIEAIIRVDRLAKKRPARHDPSAAMQLVLAEPPQAQAMVLMQDVEAHKKRAKKTWVRMARRKLKSQQMIAALKKLISLPDAARMTMEDLRVKVCEMIGVDFHAASKPNMFEFFQKHARRLWHKKADLRRKKPASKRRAKALVFVNDADAVKAWSETRLMWAEDHWPLKFAMLDAYKGCS